MLVCFLKKLLLINLVLFSLSAFLLSFFSVFSNFEKIRYCPRFVCPSVRRATTFYGVDWLGSFMARSIAYDPRAWTKEGIFFGPILAPVGGVWSPNSIHYHIKIRFYWYLRRVMSRMLDRVRRVAKVPLDPKSAPTLKSRYTLWSTYTQWSEKIRLPVTQWRLASFLSPFLENKDHFGPKQVKFWLIILLETVLCILVKILLILTNLTHLILFLY